MSRSQDSSGNTPHSYLVGGARTPIGAFLGSLSSLTAPELGAHVIQACAGHLGSDPQICEVIMGNVLQAGVGQAPARQAALRAEIAPSVPCVTVNKVCGSGLKAVMMADQAIRAGDAKTIIAGGMESMTNAPFLLPSMRKGAKYGSQETLDALQHDGLTCAFEHCQMGNHAEYTARKFDISREAQDFYAAQSQSYAAEAQAQGLFNDEIVAISIKNRKGEITVDADECIRPDTTIESLAQLRPAFDKDGTVTAGNASCISDGAAAVIVANEEAASQMNSDFRFKILGAFTSGLEPRDLFIAPVEAIKGVANKAGVSLDSIDFFEINEAFAAQMIACIEQLQLNPAMVNVNGGGISLGHPIGASGARCLVTLMHTMKKNQAKLGIVSLCLGGGNAVAMLIENQC